MPTPTRSQAVALLVAALVVPTLGTSAAMATEIGRRPPPIFGCIPQRMIDDSCPPEPPPPPDPDPTPTPVPPPPPPAPPPPPPPPPAPLPPDPTQAAPAGATAKLERWALLSKQPKPDKRTLNGTPPHHNGQLSWRMEKDLGRAYPTQVPGSAPLYRCFLYGWNEMSSRDPGCEGAGVNLGVLGHVLTGPTTDSVPLYRCRLASRPDGFEAGDHFDSLQADCEGNPSDGIVGWILPAPATTPPPPPPPPPAPTPAYKSAVLGHTCDAWRGLLLQIKAPNGPVPAGTTWKVSKSDIQPIALTTIPDHPDISVEVIDYRNLKVIAKRDLPRNTIVNLHTYNFSIPNTFYGPRTAVSIEGTSLYGGSRHVTWWSTDSSPC
ncbi:hypothetical protein [Tessaracoccus flavescens]|nr:hypothetical protein [Tessaracoccus flavescens]